MAIDYDYLENRFFEILLKFLPERKYVDLEDSSLASQFESSTIHVNYNPNEPIWFFKDSIDGSIIYFFGLKDENNIKLTLKFNKNKSKSSIELFTSGKIAVKVRFTKEGAEIFDPMKKIFKIRNPSTKQVKYNYIMLLLDDESEIIPEIAKLINLIDFDYKEETLLIKGFKENANEDNSDNLTESVKPPVKSDGEDDSNSSEDISNENFTDNDNEFDVEEYISQSNYDFSIEKIISEIDCTNFSGKSFEDDSLIEKFEEYINSLIFGFVSEGLDDEESSKLIVCIREDISNGKIYGNAMDITEFYFDEYRSIKKRFLLNNFLNDYLKSDDFDKLLDMYDDYTEDMISRIINHVRIDISQDYSMDTDTVIFKLEYYFKAESNKNVYFTQIDTIKANSQYYKNEYRLTNEEFDGILDYIQTKISEGYHIKNINNCLINKINEQVDLNRDESRLKLKKLLFNPEFIEKNNISSEELSQISEYFGDLIYKNEIRSENINESYLLLMRDVL